MNSIKKIGAVCYMDLLGFSYLTQLLGDNSVYEYKTKETSFFETKVKDLRIAELGNLSDYIIQTANKISDSDGLKVSDWACSTINNNLQKFHDIVKSSCASYPSIICSTISDSLFLVSESSDDILFAVANIFRKCIKSGILLRAGLSHGEYYIIQTDLAKINFYGKSVTEAVRYEKTGKGCRVFTNSDFPITCKIFEENPVLFSAYKNYKDYETFDCFEWLMLLDDYVVTASDVMDLYSFHNREDLQKTVDLFYDNEKILSYLKHSPMFNWNLENNNGTIQMGASIEYVATTIDSIYKLCNFIDLKDYGETVTDGISYIKSQRRDESVLLAVIEEKKRFVDSLFALKN